MIKKTIITIILLVSAILLGHAQRIAVKTNLPYWVTATTNLGLEVVTSKKTTFELTGGLNRFDLSETKRFRHWLIQPEFRWWTCEAFNGHFFGIHALGGQFNIGGFDIPLWKSLKESRYQGYAYGGGISYGYQWILGKRWSLEFNAGVGYARMHYDRFRCGKCGEKQGTQSKNYLGPTKAALSVVYFIK